MVSSLFERASSLKIIRRIVIMLCDISNVGSVLWFSGPDCYIHVSGELRFQEIFSSTVVFVYLVNCADNKSFLRQ